MLNNLFKDLFKNPCCKHKNTTTITNIYGDTINSCNCKCLKICNDCYKLILDKDYDIENIKEGDDHYDSL